MAVHVVFFSFLRHVFLFWRRKKQQHCINVFNTNSYPHCIMLFPVFVRFRNCVIGWSFFMEMILAVRVNKADVCPSYSSPVLFFFFFFFFFFANRSKSSLLLHSIFVRTLSPFPSITSFKCSCINWPYTVHRAIFCILLYISCFC